MKIRSGFVSNSSTTSFSLYGVHIDYDDYDKHAGLKAIRKMRKKDPKQFERFLAVLKKQYTYLANEEPNVLELLKKDANDLDHLERQALEEAIEYNMYELGEIFLTFLAKEAGIHDKHLQIWALSFNGIYMGWHWDTADDKKTLGQFKKGVKERLKKVFGPKISCRSHEGEWSTEP